jgi:hypothetical protein
MDLSVYGIVLLWDLNIEESVTKTVRLCCDLLPVSAPQATKKGYALP